MKNVFYSLVLLAGMAFIQPAKAQIHVQVNIGQPQWGPVGYAQAMFYYLPELDLYYDVANRNYTYYENGRWVSYRNLPRRYRHVDLYRTYKVVINSPRPWHNHRHYHDRYHRYAHNYSQIAIRDGHGKHVHKARQQYHKKQQKRYKKIIKARSKHHQKMAKRHGKHR